MIIRDKTAAKLDGPGSIIERDFYQLRPMIYHPKSPQYIVDVGANAGSFAIAASNAYPDAEIIIIEPDSQLIEDIKQNVREWKCTAKFHYAPYACVGTEKETVRFVRLVGCTQGSFIRGTCWTPNIRHHQTEEFDVPAITLPKLLEECGFPRIDVLKINAEGVEGEILMNLKQSGWMPRVRWIRGDWHGQQVKTKIKNALNDTHTYHLQRSKVHGYIIAHNKTDA